MKIICSCCHYPFERIAKKEIIVHHSKSSGNVIQLNNETLTKKRVESDKFNEENSVESTNSLCPDCYNGVFLLNGARQS